MGTLAWTLLCFTAGLLAAAWWRRRARRSRVSCDDRGLFARELGLGRIPWEEIEGAYPPTRRDPDALFLRLRVSRSLAERLREGAARGGREPRPGETFDVRLDLSGATMTPAELLQAILLRGEAPRRATRRPLLQPEPGRSRGARRSLSGSGPVLILPPGSPRAPRAGLRYQR